MCSVFRLKDLEGQLLMEKNKVNKLEQLIRAKSPPPSIKKEEKPANKEKKEEKATSKEKKEDKAVNKEREKTPPGQLLSPKTAKQLIMSPGTQITSDSLQRQNSLQRMHHNIPHR